MNPYRVLGLDGDATEAEVKRAYARLLKQHRPDSDPDGFQRVHEAYTQCLAHARYRAEYGANHYEDDEVEEEAFETATADSYGDVANSSSGSALSHTDADATSLPEPAPTHEWLPETRAGELLENETQVAFNVDEFVDELMQRACTQPDSDLIQWLHGHEALYALQLKQFLVAPVANALAQSEQLPADENVSAMLTFFGLDSVGQQHPWVAHSLQVAWERLEDRRQFERVRREYDSPRTKLVDRLLWRELVTPRHWLRFLAILLCPFLPSRTRNLLLTVEHLAPREAHARITAASARFWRLAVDRDRLDWRRWLVVLARLPLILPIAAYIALISRTELSLRSLSITGISVLGLWFAWAVATIGWRRLVRFNQAKLHWDLPLAGACLMLALALLAGATLPSLAGPLFGLTVMCWFVQRNGAIYWVGAFAVLTGGALVMCLGVVMASAEASVGVWWWISAGAYAVVSVLAHDAIYARVHQETLVWARGQPGWLGWLLGIHSALIAIVLIVAPLRG